MIKSLAPK